MQEQLGSSIATTENLQIIREKSKKLVLNIGILVSIYNNSLNVMLSALRTAIARASGVWRPLCERLTSAWWSSWTPNRRHWAPATWSSPRSSSRTSTSEPRRRPCWATRPRSVCLPHKHFDLRTMMIPNKQKRRHTTYYYFVLQLRGLALGPSTLNDFAITFIPIEKQYILCLDVEHCNNNYIWSSNC